MFIKQFIFTFILVHYSVIETYAVQLNKTHHPQRVSTGKSYYKNEKVPAYRSFQPVAVKYHRLLPRTEERADYDITSYDAEYGVVSNFTSSIYDDNPPLYPNPEVVASQSNQGSFKPAMDNRVPDAELELPDDSLADADLKGHNVIDSVTYLYGFNNCHGVRTEWMVLIVITGLISILLMGATVFWLLWSQYAKEFRAHSKLYPISINFCCCLEACTVIYLQAIMGVTSPSHCEKIALLLHYAYLVCSIWIILMAASITEYSQSNSVMSLKYNYLIAYGVPAIYVMFNYAISLEQYEIKHYCWMSIEKGMVLGFMAPAMLLILMNTTLIIMGLQSVNEKQAQLLTAKIQEIVDHHITHWPKIDPGQLAKAASIDALDDIYSPTCSRKNTDSSDTLDKEYNSSEEDCHYVNMGMNEEPQCSGHEGNGDMEKTISDKGLLNLYMDNISWKSSWNTDGNELKTYLNLCLVMEPFFAVNWVMGVVAIENASHWSTPTIYLILVSCMHVYLATTLSTTLPILRCSKDTDSCCDDVITETTMIKTRTTDSIPLLEPAIQQPNVTPPPVDTISTISI